MWALYTQLLCPSAPQYKRGSRTLKKLRQRNRPGKADPGWSKQHKISTKARTNLVQGKASHGALTSSSNNYPQRPQQCSLKEKELIVARSPQED